MSTLMLIDGNSLTYRAFHALPPDLATTTGISTNAVLGFTSMLINLARDHRPDGMCVTFDLPEPTFRHKMVDTYKANRDKTPDTLIEQMGWVRKVVQALRIPIAELPGFEADDVIATLATRAAGDGHDVLIVTGDRDSYQLVEDPHIKVVYNKRGVSDYALYDEAGILERTGVRPEQYVQYAALRGDPSDNLPGVPGVGEKTAAKLINKYGGIDGIFANVEEQTPKLKSNLIENEALARLNVDMMELKRNAPVEVEVAALLSLEDFDVEELRDLFDHLEFRMLDRVLEAFSQLNGPSDGSPPAPSGTDLAVTKLISLAADKESVDRLAVLVGASDPVAIAAGGEGVDPIAGLAIVSDSEANEVFWLPLAATEDGELGQELTELLTTFLSAEGPGLVAHQAKPLVKALLGQGMRMQGLVLDTALGAYLLDPSRPSYGLDDLLIQRTDYQFPADDGPPAGQLDFGENPISPAQRAATNALAVAKLASPIAKALTEQSLDKLNSEIEVPLVGVLARMEAIGIGVNRAELEALSAEMTAEASMLAGQIQEDAGEEFNVNSTKALQAILFEKLELTPGKKTKTGFSTNQATLEKLLGDHPIIEHLLHYREVEKLRSTYGTSLLAAVDPDDRIRATFNQTVARTGRLSSENPNLHNIPVRTELGRGFRKAFVPREGTEFVVADYNQIELRCIAHLSGDPGLVGAFQSGEDIHRSVAAAVFGVAPEEVTYQQRSRAKMVSYGLAYGMEAYGLGQRLGIKTSEAAQILESYFAGFPSVKAYMEATVTEARNRGYTETLFGRRRAIPELQSDRVQVRQAGERQAMNAGIQGLAADIFKVALVRLEQRLLDDGLQSRVVLQVHDEVILEVPPQEKDRAVAATVEVLMGAFDLQVPLEVNLSFGNSWAEAKE